MKQPVLYVVGLVFAALVGGSAMATIPVPARAASCSGENVILTLPAWYRGLAVPDGDSCRIISPTEAPATGAGDTAEERSLSAFIWTIVLNIVEIMLQVIGYIAVGFIIYGGFLFLTSAGSPDGAAKGRRTILNAVIGLVLAISSVAIINLAARGLGL